MLFYKHGAQRAFLCAFFMGLGLLGTEACFADQTKTPPPEFVLEYYTLPGCHDCEEIEAGPVNEAIRYAHSRGIAVRKDVVSVLEPAGFERLQARLLAAGLSYTGTPILYLNGKILSGNDLEAATIRAALPAIDGQKDADPARPEALSDNPGVHPGSVDLSIPLVFFAGLVDGVNPCALTTLLFLLSALSLGGKNSRALLPVGIGFTVGVFGAYTLIGFGLLKSAVLAETLPWLGTTIRIVTIVSLAIFALLSLRDAVLIKQGKVAQVSLKLPRAFTTTIHHLVRNGSTLWLAGGGAVALGAAISLVEFVCTGQVYLPTIVYLAQTGAQGAYLLLILYNFAFIIPMIAVFFVVRFGMTHQALVALVQKHMSAAKLLLALVFALLAVVLVLV